MFVRFAVPGLADAANRRAGLFYAARRMLNADELDPVEAEAVRAILRWFGRNLPKTGRIAPVSNARRVPKRLVWLRESAGEHVGRMAELAAILRANDVVVDEIRTLRPGRIVYRDAHQIVAEPPAALRD